MIATDPSAFRYGNPEVGRSQRSSLTIFLLKESKSLAFPIVRCSSGKNQKAVQKILHLRTESGYGHEDDKGNDGEVEKEEEEGEEEEEDDERGRGEGRLQSGLFPGKACKVMESLEPPELQALEKAKIRKYVIPKLNFEATSFPDLIDWSNVAFTEPPTTTSLSVDEIRDLVTTPLKVAANPCHTQAVERSIRLITEAASSVFGHDARDGFIRQRMLSWKEVVNADTKVDFFPKLEQS